MTTNVKIQLTGSELKIFLDQVLTQIPEYKDDASFYAIRDNILSMREAVTLLGDDQTFDLATTMAKLIRDAADV